MQNLITLRYFACRGRAQALRYMLIDQGIEFVDERLPLDPNWPARKNDPTVSGPFGALPVLHWDGHQVAETLPIAGYLSRRLGQYVGLSDEEIARREMVASSAYLDVIRPLAEMVWQHGAPAGDADWHAWLTRHTQLVLGRLLRFEQLLAATSGAFFSGASPSAADHFVFEAVDWCRMLLGAPALVMLERCPRLVALGGAMVARPQLRIYVDSDQRPTTLTGNPREFEVRSRLLAATS